MLRTQEFVEQEITVIAQNKGLKATADVGHQGNVINYRTYDHDLTLKGSVAVHYEESYAKLINYSGRDAGESFRYGANTKGLVEEILKRLGLAQMEEGQSQSGASSSQEISKEKRSAISDAFPFAALPDDILEESAAKTDDDSSALLDLDKDLPTIKGNEK